MTKDSYNTQWRATSHHQYTTMSDYQETLLTEEQTMQFLNIPPRFFKRCIRQGKIHATRLSSKERRYSKHDMQQSLHAWLTAQQHAQYLRTPHDNNKLKK